MISSFEESQIWFFESTRQSFWKGHAFGIGSSVTGAMVRGWSRVRRKCELVVCFWISVDLKRYDRVRVLLEC